MPTNSALGPITRHVTLGRGKKLEFVLFIVQISFSIFATKICRSQQTAGFEKPAVSCFICRDCGSNCRVCPFSAGAPLRPESLGQTRQFRSPLSPTQNDLRRGDGLQPSHVAATGLRVRKLERQIVFAQEDEKPRLLHIVRTTRNSAWPLIIRA